MDERILRGVMAAALLASAIAVRADDPVGPGGAPPLPAQADDGRGPGDSPVPDLDYSWPDRWPDLSGWEEDPPGV